MGPVHLFVPAAFEVQARMVLASAQGAVAEDATDETGSRLDDPG